MNCKNCGAPLNEADKFCQNCGMVVDRSVAPTNNEQILNMNSTPVENNDILGQANNNPFMSQQVNNQSDAIRMESNENFQTPNMNNNSIQNNVNAQPFNQQPMNGYNTNSVINKKDNSNMIIIIMSAVIVILLLAVIFLALNKTSTTKNNSNNGKTNDPTVEPTTTQASNTTNYVSGDYSFEIPNEFTVETNDSEIMLYNDEKAIYMETLAGYSIAMISIDEVKSAIEGEGIIVLDSKKESYNGINMLIFGAEYSGEKRALVYADIDGGILYAEVANINGEVDYNTVQNELSLIAKSAQYKAASNSIASSNKLDTLEKIIKAKK